MHVAKLPPKKGTNLFNFSRVFVNKVMGFYQLKQYCKQICLGSDMLSFVINIYLGTEHNQGTVGV